MADLNVVYRIAADISGLQDGVNRAAASTERLEGIVGSVGKTLIGAFSATAVLTGLTRLVTSTIQYADALSNLNARTGVSIQGLQKIESIGVTAGVSMETLARSVTMLQKNLDSPAANAALRNMGLSYEHIRSLSPEEQFVEIGRSLAKIEDPIKRANAGTALFGRTWDQVAGAFEQNVDDIINNTRRMTDAQVEALDKAGDRWDLFVLDSGRAIKSWLGEIVIAGDQVERIMQSSFSPSRWDELRESFLNMPKVGAPDLSGAGPIAPDPNIAAVIRESNAQIEESIRKRQRAEAEATEATKKAEQEVSESLERIRFGYFMLGQSAETASQNVSGFSIRTSEAVAINNDYSRALTEAQIEADSFGHVLKVNVMPSLQGVGGELHQNQLRLAATSTESITLREQLGMLSEAFALMGQIGGKGLSDITRGIGTAISGMSLAIDSVSTLKSGFGSLGAGSTLKGIMSITSGIGGIVSVASAAISAVKSLWNWAKGGEEGTKVNPARDDWFRGRDVGDIGKELAEFGVSGEDARKMIDRVFKSKTMRDFSSARDEIDRILRGARPMAEGGLVRQPTLAMIGEAGPELVTPLKDLGSMEAFGGGRKLDAIERELSALRSDLATDRRSAPHLFITAWKDALAHS